MSKLKKERDECLQELSDLGHQLRSYAKEQQLASELTNLETRQKSITYELNLSNEKLKKNKGEVDAATKQSAKITTELNKVNKEISALEKQVEKLQESIHKVEDEVFATFSKEVGIKNVREYENARVSRAKEDGEARLRFSTQKSRIQQLIAYEGKRDLEKALNDQKSKIEKEKANLKKEELAADKIKEAAETEKAKHQELEKELEKEQQLQSTKDRAIQNLKSQLEALKKESVDDLKHSSIVENQMEQLRNKRHAVFRNCMRDEIGLPFVNGEFPDGIESLIFSSL